MFERFIWFKPMKQNNHQIKLNYVSEDERFGMSLKRWTAHTYTATHAQTHTHTYLLPRTHTPAEIRAKPWQIFWETRLQNAAESLKTQSTAWVHSASALLLSAC